MAAATLGTASPAAAEGTIRTSPGATAVPGQYIVVLTDDAASREQPGQAADDLVSRYGGTVHAVWEHAVRGFALRASEADARALAADPRVSYVEQDTVVETTDVQPVPLGPGNLDHIDQRQGVFDGKYAYLGSGGRNVRAYVIDTGIRTTHNEFGGRATWGFNAVDTNNTDCNGHGTHVAGILGGKIYGVAKSVNLVAVKVLDCGGSGSASGVISGVNWVTANAVRPAVANMSLGGGANTTLDTAVRNSIATGITYAVASGNGDFLGNPVDACTRSPARVAEALTVNASTNSDVSATFTNFGACTDIFAPGVSISSAWNTSDGATNQLSGTSMASPHVAGVAALHLQRHPLDTPEEVATTLVVQGAWGVVTGAMPGSPNVRLYSRYTMDDPEGDYNGDQNTDRTVWRPSSGTWFVNGISTTQWGVSGDIPVPGDYNGDGMTDTAVWRPSTGTWFVKGISTTQWGVSGDIPVPADFTGDGKTDLAVWRPSTGTWFVLGMTSVAWGVPGDVPVPGDYNGDGLLDRAVWRPSTGTWFVHGVSTAQWGLSNDVPVPGDFDGDGATDMAVWRPSSGTWFVLGKPSVVWGVAGDVPVPGDFNGDGKIDRAIWRPSTGVWHVQGVGATAWGVSGDIPLAS
jgi:subtilisin family serine protease